jgi:signal transduction histidine kinase
MVWLLPYWYNEEYHRRTEIQVNINDQYMKDSRLPAEIEIALFRIAQEALNNVAKHANATQIDIELFEEVNYTMMAITDNGSGFDTKPKFTHLTGGCLLCKNERGDQRDFARSVPEQGTKLLCG